MMIYIYSNHVSSVEVTSLPAVPQGKHQTSRTALNYYGPTQLMVIMLTLEYVVERGGIGVMKLNYCLDQLARLGLISYT